MCPVSIYAALYGSLASVAPLWAAGDGAGHAAAIVGASMRCGTCEAPPLLPQIFESAPPAKGNFRGTVTPLMGTTAKELKPLAARKRFPAVNGRAAGGNSVWIASEVCRCVGVSMLFGLADGR